HWQCGTSRQIPLTRRMLRHLSRKSPRTLSHRRRGSTALSFLELCLFQWDVMAICSQPVPVAPMQLCDLFSLRPSYFDRPITDFGAVLPNSSDSLSVLDVP